MNSVAKPFRWNIHKREQIETLIKETVLDESELYYDQFVRQISAQLLARSDGDDLIFVGRSVENYYDYLSGIFVDLPHTPSLELFPYSDRWIHFGHWGTASIDKIRQESDQQVPGGPAVRELYQSGQQSARLSLRKKAFMPLFQYLKSQKLDPHSLMINKRRICFFDLVSEGGTFESIVGLWRGMSLLQGLDWAQIEKRIRFVALTLNRLDANGGSPWKDTRFEKKYAQKWADDPDLNIYSFKQAGRAKTIVVPYQYYQHIGNMQNKVSQSQCWENRDIIAANSSPSHTDEHLQALGYAAHLFDIGTSRTERLLLSDEITGQPQMKQAYLRKIVAILRAKAV